MVTWTTFLHLHTKMYSTIIRNSWKRCAFELNQIYNLGLVIVETTHLDSFQVKTFSCRNLSIFLAEGNYAPNWMVWISVFFSPFSMLWRNFVRRLKLDWIGGIILEFEGLINRTADRCCFILLRQSQTAIRLHCNIGTSIPELIKEFSTRN